MPYLEPSRPGPEDMVPLNGATSLEMIPVLTPSMPYSNTSPTRKNWLRSRAWSLEKPRAVSTRLPSLYLVRSDECLTSNKETSAGISTNAPTMFQTNSSTSSNPISA